MTRRRLFSGRMRALTAVVVAAVAGTALTASSTSASWTDQEWVNASVGTADCSGDEGFANKAEGRMLSGELLGFDLDSAAEVSRVEVQNDGTDTSFEPASAQPTADGGRANALSAEVLGVLPLELTNLLQLNLGTETGAINQYARALSDQDAVGASGTVTPEGAVDLDGAESLDPEERLANIDLRSLASTVAGDDLGDTLDDVAGLSLDVGAVAGRAELDPCLESWSLPREAAPLAGELFALQSADTEAIAEDIVDGLSRQYLTASTTLTFKSDLLVEISTPVLGDPDVECSGVLGGVQCALANLVGEDGGVNQLLGALGTLTAGLNLGLLAIDLGHPRITVDADLQELVSSLVSDDLHDDERIISVNVATGSVVVDTSGLLAAAYPERQSGYLNAAPANTNLLTDERMTGNLVRILTDLLDDWIAKVSETLEALLNTVRVAVNLDLTVAALGSDLVSLEIAVDCRQKDSTNAGPGCTLHQLTAPQNYPSLQSITVQRNELQSPGLLSIILGLLLNPVLDAISTLVSALTSGVVPLVASVVEDLLAAPINLLLDETLPGVATLLDNAIPDIWSSLGLNGLLEVTLNVQNGYPGEPAEWAGTAAEGEYYVAALRIAILGNNGIVLRLGQASVGPGCSPAQAPTKCANY